MIDERMLRFEARRETLKKMSDEELKQRFWQLCSQVVDPIVELARTHTSPSIERSILLRMGIDSITAHAVVERISQAGLLGKGAGHVVWMVSQKTNKDIPAAASAILDDEDILQDLF